MKAIYAVVFSYSECTKSSNSGKKEAPSDTIKTVMSQHAHSTILKILAYVPAGFKMFSRIYQHQHWLSNKILAAAIGYFTGNWVVDLHEGRRHKINFISMYPLRITYLLN